MSIFCTNIDHLHVFEFQIIYAGKFVPTDKTPKVFIEAIYKPEEYAEGISYVLKEDFDDFQPHDLIILKK